MTDDIDLSIAEELGLDEKTLAKTFAETFDPAAATRELYLLKRELKVRAARRQIIPASLSEHSITNRTSTALFGFVAMFGHGFANTNRTK